MDIVDAIIPAPNNSNNKVRFISKRLYFITSKIAISVKVSPL